MRRRILIALLSVGAIAGLAMAAMSFRWHAAHADTRHEAFKQKVADICTESALRVYEQKAPNKPK